MKKTKRTSKPQKFDLSKQFNYTVSTLSAVVILGTATWAFVLITSLLTNK